MAERTPASRTRKITPRKPTSRRAVPRRPRTPPKPSTVAPARRPAPRSTHRTYRFAVGRRKSAIARVRYTEQGSGAYLINGQDVHTYFPTFELQKLVTSPFEVTAIPRTADISIKVIGGGKHGQAEAIRLGLSRVLVLLQPDLRTILKRSGFLTRDPRVKERKKYGLKRARRAPQWQKR